MHLNEIQTEIKDVINEALKKTPDFFKCRHIRDQTEAEKLHKGCN